MSTDDDTKGPNFSGPNLSNIQKSRPCTSRISSSGTIWSRHHHHHLSSLNSFSSSYFHHFSSIWVGLLGLVLLTITTQPHQVQSMGTLLHAGPTCYIQPNINRRSQISQPLPPLASTDGVTLAMAGPSPGSFKHRGICYSTLLCKQKGGVAIGKCGLGNACCVFPQSCDSISVRNSTYFTNPHYPAPVNRTGSMLDDHERSSNKVQEDDSSNKILQQFCSLIIHRMPGIHPICQLRLDFIEYDIEGPDGKWISLDDLDSGPLYENGPVSNNEILDSVPRPYCQTDLITLRAMHTEEDIVPPICPRTVGQHVTIDIRKHIGPFILNINTIPNLFKLSKSQSLEQPNWNGRRRWNILINQIECSNPGDGTGGESGTAFLRNLLRNLHKQRETDESKRESERHKSI